MNKNQKMRGKKTEVLETGQRIREVSLVVENKVVGGAKTSGKKQNKTKRKRLQSGHRKAGNVLN
jgi:hypothetical protein